MRRNCTSLQQLAVCGCFILSVSAFCQPAVAAPDPFFPQQREVRAADTAPRYRLMGVMVWRRQSRLVLIEQLSARQLAEKDTTGGTKKQADRKQAGKWWMLQIDQQLPGTGWRVAGIDSQGAIFARGDGDETHMYRHPGQMLEASPAAAAGGR